MAKRKQFTKEEIINIYKESRYNYYHAPKDAPNNYKWALWEKMQTCILILSQMLNITRLDSELMLEKGCDKNDSQAMD